MSTPKPGGYLEAVLWELDELNVPQGDLRRVTIALAEMFDHPDRPGHMAAAAGALDKIRAAMRDMYGPRSPLRDQRDYNRARRTLAAKGIELPRWDDLTDGER